jgi:outer membrane protein TolC
MKERILSCAICLLMMTQTNVYSQAGAQNSLTLKEAVEAAINNNLLVRQTDLQMQAASVNLSQAKSNLIPDLFGNLNHGMNQTVILINR